MTSEDLFNDIEKFKYFRYSTLECMCGNALTRSIIRMLVKFGIKDNQILVFEPRKAKLRGAMYDTNKPIYGVSFVEYNDMEGDFFSTRMEIDRKIYELWYHWIDPLPIDANAVNSSFLQSCNIDVLNKIYEYLRIENNIPKNKRNFIVENRKERTKLKLRL